MANCFKVGTLVLSRQSVTATGNLLYVNGLLVGSGLYAPINALAETGSNLYNLVIGASGQATVDYATKVQLTQSGVIIEGQINSLSGWASSLIQSTGQQVWTHGQNNALNLSGALQQTGSNLYRMITGMSGQANSTYATQTQLNSLSGFTVNVSGYLQNQITEANADVSSINRQSGALLITGTGGLTVISGSPQLIIVSGDSIYTSGFVNAVSGGLQTQVFQTGAAAVVHANGIGSIISGNLSQTGSTLWNRDLSVSGGLEARIAQTGQAAFLATSGASGVLQAQINTLPTTAYVNGIGVNLSGNLTQTGVILDGRISSLSGFTLGVSGYLQSQISQGNAGVLSVNRQSGALLITGTGGLTVISGSPQLIIVSGDSLYTSGFISSVSGGLQTQIFQTGVSAVNYANGIGQNLSGNLNSLSGWTDNLFVHRTGNETISGDKLFTGNLAIGEKLSIGADSAGAAAFYIRKTNLSTYFDGLGGGSVLRNYAQNGTLVAQCSSSATHPFSFANGSLQTIMVIRDEKRVGINTVVPSKELEVNGNIAAVSGFFSGSTNLSDIFYPRSNPSGFITGLDGTGGLASIAQLNSLSGFVINVVSGGLEIRIAQTGSAAIAQSNGIGLNLSGNLTISGQVLQNRIDSLSGWTAPAAANYVYTTGNQDIGGTKKFTSQVVYSGNNTATPILIVKSGLSFSLLDYKLYPTGATYTPITVADTQFGPSMVIGAPGQTLALGAGESYALAPQMSFWGNETLALISDDNIGMVVRLQSGAQSGVTGFWMTSFGDIGMGTLGPAAKLHVVGNVRTDSGFYSGTTNLWDIFYPRSNPSGYITGIAGTGSLATLVQLNSLSGFTVNVVSGGLENRIAQTGRAAFLATSGVSGVLQTQINSLPTTAYVNGIGINLSGNLTLTGQNLFNRINSVGSTISGNLTITGQTLQNRINSLSGYSDGIFVHRTGNELISGDKTFGGVTAYRSNLRFDVIRVSGGFTASYGNYRYVWSGDGFADTGILPSPSAVSGIEYVVKNITTGRNILLSGQIDYQQNYLLSARQSVTLWSDNVSWILT